MDDDGREYIQGGQKFGTFFVRLTLHQLGLLINFQTFSLSESGENLS